MADEDDRCDRCGHPIPEGARARCISVTEETRRGSAVEVHDAVVRWRFCERCAAALDFEQLPKPLERASAPASMSREARDELARELADFYREALGTPHRVLHADDQQPPHVDVYVYRPGTLLVGWALVTAGRCTEPVAGRRVELVMQLRPDEAESDMEESAEILRRVALRLGRELPDWTFKAVDDERFAALGKRLVYHPVFLQAVYRRPVR